MAGLNHKRRRFVDEYLVDLNATQAAIRAGYSPRSARSNGPYLLKIPAVARAVAMRQARISNHLFVTAERVVLEYARLAFADMADYMHFAENGVVLLDWSAMPEDATKAILEVTQDVYNEGRGGNQREIKRTKFKLHDKRGALDALAKHLGLFRERGGEDAETIVKSVIDFGGC
ncbi:MAG: terminase small subunit [Alphaproteobacteria bacterium]|nr:terminase small subunit [Alphaproteobacteria bacterium]